jgi:hypothetical protein
MPSGSSSNRAFWLAEMWFLLIFTISVSGPAIDVLPMKSSIQCQEMRTHANTMLNREDNTVKAFHTECKKIGMA